MTPVGLGTVRDEDAAAFWAAEAERRDGGAGAAEGDPAPRRLVDADVRTTSSKAAAASRYPTCEERA